MKKRFLRLLSVSLVLLMIPLFYVPASAGSFVKGTNSASDSYKSGPYYDRLLAVTQTGDQRTLNGEHESDEPTEPSSGESSAGAEPSESGDAEDPEPSADITTADDPVTDAPAAGAI